MKSPGFKIKLPSGKVLILSIASVETGSGNLGIE
jgi:hypothetical protein